jgi:hypothetical protein
MKHARHHLLALALLVPASIAFAQVTPPGIDPTHYWTYTNLQTAPPEPTPIAVQDQFYRQPIPVTVDRLERLLNWVRKNNSAVPDTLLHYTWWNLVEKLPTPRRVIVTNQFGSHVVQVNNLEFLLAPALKNPNAATGPTPPPANHYLCYRATGFPGPPNTYDLVDEWKVDTQHPGDLEFLCTPCLKEHNGQIFPPVDTVTHYAVYPINPHSDNFVPFTVDQFGPHPLFVTQVPPEYLFVPSTKAELPTDVRNSTWSRLKQLYH